MIRNSWRIPAAAAGLLALLVLTGCGKSDTPTQNNQKTTITVAQAPSDGNSAGSGFDSLPSDAPRINVQKVQEALAEVQNTDPDGWVADFRTRVNEINTGNDVISIDAHPDGSNNLQIIGYVSRSGQEGYHQDSDELIFSIEQTGTVANNQTPYRMTYSTVGGSAAYYDGYYYNPYLTGWYGNVILYHSWHGYYTSPAHIVVITSYRNTYRTTPAYVQQRAATQSYMTQTYHGSPMTMKPGATLGTGVMAKPGAAPAPMHVTPPAAPSPSSVTPPKASGASSGSPLNRPKAPAAAPVEKSTPATAAPATSAPKLQDRPGGLFNSRTFSPGPSKSFTRPSGGKRK